MPGTTPMLHPIDALAQPALLLRLLVFCLALAGILALAPGVEAPRLEYFGMMAFVYSWIVVLSVGTLTLLRRLLQRLRPDLAVWVFAATLFLVGLIVQTLAWEAAGRFGVLAASTPVDRLWRSIGMLALLCTLSAATFQAAWQGHAMRLRAKQAELESLQARIQPHFLFNTLNTGIALIHDQPMRAEAVLLDLADLFRAALAGPMEVSLEDELALVRRYLEIEQLRFGDRLRVDWRLDAAAVQQARLPVLALQPIVENAVRHGIEPLPTGGMLGIEVVREGDAVLVRIDNPIGAFEASGEGFRVGLASAIARVDAMTQGRGSVRSVRGDDRFVTEVRLPGDRP